MSSQLLQKGLNDQTEEMFVVSKSVQIEAQRVAQSLLISGESYAPIKTPSGGNLAFVSREKDKLSSCLFFIEVEGVTFYVGNKETL